MTLSITQSEPEPEGPSGVAGWLLLLVLKFWLDTAVRIAIGVGAVLAIFDLGGITSISGDAGLKPALANIAAGIFAAVTAVLLIRKSTKGPLFAKILLLADAGYYAWSMLNALHAPPPPVPAALPVWAKPGILGLASLAWFAYLLASKRVRNTYMRPSRRPVPEDDLTVLNLRSSRWEELFGSGRQQQTSQEPAAPPPEDFSVPEDILLQRLGARRPQERDGRQPEEPVVQQPPEPEARRPWDMETDLEAARPHPPEAQEFQQPEAPQPEAPEAQQIEEPELPAARHSWEPETHEPALPSSWRLQEPDARQPERSAAQRFEEPEEADETQQLEALKARVEEGLTRWLRLAPNHPAGKPETLSAAPGDSRAANVQAANEKFVKQVMAICDHAWSVHVGESATLPNTPDAGGSLEKELQKWAIAQAARRLTRCLDIRAAMEVNGPFENVVQDREYLLAIAEKNASDDGFGKHTGPNGYEDHSGPEIAYMLILQAQKDMFEADLWVQVARFAGDSDFPDRFELAGSKTFQDSLQYWKGRVSRMREEPAPLRPVGV